MKVTVLGAAGGIGQSLSLLLKLNDKIDELALYDVVNTPGVGSDLSHISTKAKINAYLPNNDGLSKALINSQLVVIPAGVPRKPGMTRDDLFKINAGIVAQLAEGVSKYCPNAFILLISNPVNSTVGVFAKMMQKQGVFNSRKLFGVTTLDGVRANTFISEIGGNNNNDVSKFDVPVIGGHSGGTIVPLFSIGAPKIYEKLNNSAKEALINRVQYGGDEIVQAKEGKGSATLSMAYAAYHMTNQLLNVIVDDQIDEISSFIYLDEKIDGVKELKSKLDEGVDFFALPVSINKNGIFKVNHQILDKIDDYELGLLKEAQEQLKSNIEKGVGFALK